MHSLFEEQITREQLGTIMDMELHAESFAEALSYFPGPTDFRLGPEKYLEQIRRIKDLVAVPVIASLNGITPAGWLDYAKQIEQAGADALELNVYYLATQPWETGDAVEKRTLDIVKTVKAAVKIPVAVKLSPFFSSLPNFAKQLEDAGADGLVLFNRFYQPDIDIEALEPSRTWSCPPPPSCCSACAGWPSSTGRSRAPWPSPAASTPARTRSRPSWPAPPPSSSSRSCWPGDRSSCG